MNKLGFIVLILAVVCVIAEPPRNQRFKQQRKGKFFARQEVAPESETTETITEAAAPYQASGFKPDVAFELPGEEEEAQNDGAAGDDEEPEQETEAATEGGEEVAAEEADASYPAAGVPSGRLLRLPIRKATRKFARQEVPSTSYGAPAQSYGPPATEYGVPAAEADEEDITAEPESESVDVTTNESARLRVRSRARSGRIVAKKQQKAAYIQLPNGSLQRVIYLTPSAAAARSGKLRAQPFVFQPLALSPSFF